MEQELKDQRINNLISLFTKGLVEECLREAHKVKKIYPDEPFIFNIIGITNASLGKFSESIKNYQKAISLNPSYIEVYNNIGVAYNGWKRYEKAIKYLDKAINLNPAYADAFNNRGNVYKELGENEDAIEDYEKALQLNQDFEVAKVNLALCNNAVGSYGKAERLFRDLLLKYPDRLDYKYYLADVLYNLKKYQL